VLQRHAQRPEAAVPAGHGWRCRKE
jgi:hypothetical protein